VVSTKHGADNSRPDLATMRRRATIFENECPVASFLLLGRHRRQTTQVAIEVLRIAAWDCCFSAIGGKTDPIIAFDAVWSTLRRRNSALHPDGERS
jgi:hypothetical protein